MIIFFADREMRPLGHASTDLPNGYVIKEDLKTEEIETGVATFSCVIGFNDKNRLTLERMTNAGNYLLRSNGDENEFYTIIDVDINSKEHTIQVYAEDAGLDLINEIVGEFEATEEQTAEWYVNKFAADSGFEIGINEIPASSKRKLSWDGESTVTARLASVAKQFDDYEVSYSYAIKGLEITNKYINLYAKRGKDAGVQLRINRELDNIVTSKSVANLATAFVCEGGVPDDWDKPITFSDNKSGEPYSYDDGDFFVDGNKLKSRKANEKWSRYVWNKEPNKLNNGEGYIVRPYSYNTDNPDTLRKHAMTELKKVCDMEVNYEVDITRLPEGVKIGDRVYVVDDAGELYVSTRILLLESSVIDQTHKATLGEHLIKKSGISQKVADLAASFAETTQSAARALTLANSANTMANEAKQMADSVTEDVTEARTWADNALRISENALNFANEAQTAASGAQTAVGGVVDSVAALEQTVEEAETAIFNAHTALETVREDVKAAADSARIAQNLAETASRQAEQAEAAAGRAEERAGSSITASNEAKTLAQSASETAAAAKAEAEQNKKDVEEWAENLETYKQTVSENYSKKTDLTETTSTLQAQITANANQLSITHEQLTVIDETANDAKEKADAASTAASEAKRKADQATANAQASQAAADTAAAAAVAAQTKADTAQAAAESAQSVADKAAEDLETAKANLATVEGRIDATAEEIAAANEAVRQAQSDAAIAQRGAEQASQTAAEAQTKADQAVANAATAQSKADEAASNAATAQVTANTAAENAATAQQKADQAVDNAAAAILLANEAKGDATAAQNRANEAASVASEAQATANTAVANAATAQQKADEAASTAATAQQKADAAKTVADAAQGDLNTAKQNLAEVVSRVGATEEEIAAAEEAVRIAHGKADLADEAAKAAQDSADKALLDAAEAQKAADDAKDKADKAQKAADEAKDAADKAQADVDALKVRVEWAATEIVKNNDKIALLATKEEVETNLAGYYTKTETNAKFEETSESITSTVSKAVDEVTVGTRNRATDTSSQWTECSVNQWSAPLYHGANGTSDFTHHSSDYGLEPGDYVTFAVDIMATLKNLAIRVDCYSEDGQTSSGANMGNYIHVNSTGRSTLTLRVDEDYPVFKVYIGADGTVTGDSYEQYKCLKIEHGIKATDWTQAPEDVEGDIDDANARTDKLVERISEAESKIQQLADSISLLVRNGDSAEGSMLKVDANGMYYFDISGINETLANATDNLNDLEGIVLDANGKIDVLNSAAEALRKRTEYVSSYTDENDQPCLELGEGDSKFKVYITNTEIRFADGTTIPAYINRQMLVIEKTMIKNELQFGDDEEEGIEGVWVWKRRSNGNLGLMWKAVSE